MTTDYAARRDTAAADVLDAIDAVTTPRCGTCEVDLHPDGPSPWWCSEPCAVVWQQSITPPLPDQSDMEPASLPRRIVCRGTPDRMDVWLQHGDGPDQCAELAEWLSANSLPVNDIPVDSTIHVEGGQITVDVLRRGDNGGIPVDPAGNPYRDTLTVPLIHEWPARPMTHQERWYHVALAVQRSSRERWTADRQMVEVTTVHGDGTETPLPRTTGEIWEWSPAGDPEPDYPILTALDETHILVSPGETRSAPTGYHTTGPVRPPEPLLTEEQARAIHQMAPAMEEFSRRIQEQNFTVRVPPFVEALRRVARQLWGAGLVPHPAPDDARQRALEHVRNRNTGPRDQQRAPRRIRPGRTR